ncbi:MAG: DUF3267 domain-containing protein [Eubacteriales bacterium]|nr:DUF3267 domain-containing protein [Eubacteriales bacterium]
MMKRRAEMGKQAKKQRKLTAAEQRRKEQLERLEADLYQQGYRKHDLTIGLVFANVMAIVLGVPILVVLYAAFFIRNTHLQVNVGSGMLLLFLALLGLVVVHELIHGITWAIFAPSHWKAIEFGFVAKYLTPYCTCGEPLKRNQYIVGALMPTLLVGILPAMIAIFSGNVFWLVVGSVMVLGGGGDLTIILKLLRYRSKGKDVIYMDHPYEAGVIAFER